MLMQTAELPGYFREVDLLAQILDGITVAKFEREKIKQAIQTVKAIEVPALAIILAGDDPASQIYAQRLKKLGESLEIKVKMIQLPQQVEQSKIIETINKLNHDPNIGGILPMMPLPRHISADAIAQAISPAKDVDAIHPYNVGMVAMGKSSWAPCTPRAVMAILDYYAIDIAGKQVVIIGRSNVVGKPLFQLMLARNATVTVCHSYTQNLAAVVSQADVVIAAVGRPRMISADMIKPGAIVIDVGINQDGDRIVGDVDFEAVKKIAGAITPVPGGVGSVSTTMVMQTLTRYV